MSVQIKINDLELLELAKISTSLTDLSRKLKIRPNNKNLNELKNYLIILSYDVNDLKSKNVSVLNNRELLENIVKESFTYTDILRKFNLSITGGNQKTLRSYIDKYNISTKHFNKKSYLLNGDFGTKKTYEEMFCLNSCVTGQAVKSYILKHKIIKYECKKCNNKGFWNNEPITLQLEHVNGNNRDHRLENLMFLCPNCHSQTKTYGSKNRKDKKEITIKTPSIIPRIECNIEGFLSRLKNFNSIKEVLDSYQLKNYTNTRKKIYNILTTYSKDLRVKEFTLRIRLYRKIIYPEIDILLKKINEQGYSCIAREIGCSDNAIRKHLKKHKVF